MASVEDLDDETLDIQEEIVVLWLLLVRSHHIGEYSPSRVRKSIVVVVLFFESRLIGNDSILPPQVTVRFIRLRPEPTDC